MRRIPIIHLIAFTHISVFFFTALFVGFATYSLTRDYLGRQVAKTYPQISEKASAEGEKEKVVYERRDVIVTRPNGFNKERVTGFAHDLETNEEHIIYSFIDDPFEKRLQSTVPTTTLLSNGNIFINGVSDLGYAILDLAGNNLSLSFDALKKRDFPLSNILFGKDGQIFYTYRGENSKEKNTTHKIYSKNGDEKPGMIDSPSFPSGEFWLTPAGWSSKENEFYVQLAADADAFAKLWRVSLANKIIQPFASITGALTKDLQVCSSQDFAVFISGTVDPTIGRFGGVAAPSRLMISNLQTDSAVAVYSSPRLLSDLMVSCNSQKILVKENDQFHLFDINGKRYSRPFFTGTPLFWSRDGSSLVLQEDQKIIILNLKDGKRKILGEDKLQGGSVQIRYTVLGLSAE
ncbi:MAG: hypothetical protein AAB588_03905 [Patescibacteria group bacterium]